MSPKRHCQFYHSRHFLKRIQERGLSLKACEEVVASSESAVSEKVAGKHGGHVYKFVGKHNSQKIVVIAEVKKEEYWTITAHPFDKYVQE